MDTSTSSFKVLIPTDFSVQAEYAYILVNRLREHVPIEVHFIHVMHVPVSVALDEDGNIKSCGEIDTRHINEKKKIVECQLQRLKEQYGDEIQTHLAYGHVKSVVSHYAEHHGFDFIAMGTKGDFGWHERLIGSETQHVARMSKVPVLSLMCDRSDWEVRNILFVHNFDDTVEEELQLMKKMTALFGAQLHFLHVVTSKKDKDDAHHMSDMKDFALKNNISAFTPHVIHDTNIEAGVTHFNQMQEMDLLFMGTYGHGGVFHQSVAERLINHLYKPMITFRLND
jgi:nucleotide-binding universal stress UspA family protein